MDIVGSFEGYVPTPTDLYLRGNNILGFTGGYSSYNYKSPGFDSGQLTLSVSNAYHCVVGSFDTTGYNYLNFEIYLKGTNNYSKPAIYTEVPGELGLVSSVSIDSSEGYKTIQLNISAINVFRNWILVLHDWYGAVYRIWLS